MASVETILVSGAGIGGLGTAIGLAQQGVGVRVIDAKENLTTLGSGITVQGNALRVLRDLGVWDEVRDAGFAFEGLGLRAPDPTGTVLVELTELRTGGEDLPATLGIHRPDLVRILLDRALALGVRVDHGVALEEIEQDDDGVTATLSDGTTARCDLMVAADGIRSHLRRLVGIEDGPRPTGMGIWRVFAPRPTSVTRTDLFYGGPSYIAGYCPTGEDSLYAYVVTDHDPHNATLNADQGLARLQALSAAHHGPWDDIRPLMTDSSRINYTKFETHVVPAPWHRGRVVLVGDAAHSCPPTVAQGAAMALEDAWVLSELLGGDSDQSIEEVLEGYTARRLPRARVVVEGSVQIGEWLMSGERGDVPGVMGRISSMLTERP